MTSESRKVGGESQTVRLDYPGWSIAIVDQNGDGILDFDHGDFVRITSLHAGWYADEQKSRWNHKPLDAALISDVYSKLVSADYLALETTHPVALENVRGKKVITGVIVMILSALLMGS